MQTDSPRRRFWVPFLAAITLDVLIGIVGGALVWTGYLSAKEKSIIAALGGKVEEALDMLLGLATLGAVVGAAVGLVHGLLRAMTKRGQDP